MSNIQRFNHPVTARFLLLGSILTSSTLLPTSAQSNEIPNLNGPFTLVYEMIEKDQRTDEEFEEFIELTSRALRDTRLNPRPSEADIDRTVEGMRLSRQALKNGRNTEITISSEGSDLVVRLSPLNEVRESTDFILNAKGSYDFTSFPEGQTLQYDENPDLSSIYNLPYLGVSIPRINFFKGPLDGGRVLLLSKADETGDWTFGPGKAVVRRIDGSDFVASIHHLGSRGPFAEWTFESPKLVNSCLLPCKITRQAYHSATAYQTPIKGHTTTYRLLSASTRALPTADFAPARYLKANAHVVYRGKNGGVSFSFKPDKGTLEEQVAAQKLPIAPCIKPEANSINAVPAGLSVTFFSVAGMMVVSKFVIKQPTVSNKD